MSFEVEFSDSSTEEEPKTLAEGVLSNNARPKTEESSCSRSGRVRRMRYLDFSLIDENQDNLSEVDYLDSKYGGINFGLSKKRKQDADEDYENEEYKHDKAFKDGKNRSRNKYRDYDEDYDNERDLKESGRRRQKGKAGYKKEAGSTRPVRSSRKTVNYSDSDGSVSLYSISDDYDEYESCKYTKKEPRRRENKRITYEDDYDSDDAKEGDDFQLSSDQVQENVKNIDRVLESRSSKEDNGTMEYKIKWMGYSHLHNTWETLDSLIRENVGGMRRLENFQKKMAEVRQRRQFMTEDEIEQEDINFEIQKQLDMDALIPERIVDIFQEEEIVADEKENDSTYAGDKKERTRTQIYYFVKWLSCPYDQCTWESYETLVEHNFLHHIEAFNAKMDFICKYNGEYDYEMRSLSLTSFEPYLSTPFYMGNARTDMSKTTEEIMSGESSINLDNLNSESSFQNNKLRDYQVYGLNWIISRFKKNVNVLLADEMGLGKTVQTISVVGHCIYMEKIIAPFLVVVPQSTSDNWLREFKKWLPDLNVVLYHGNAYARELIRNYELKTINMASEGNLKREANFCSKVKKRFRFDILITTPAIINSQLDCEFLKQIEWYMMIVDEAHQLKNRDSKRFKELHDFETKYRLLLSGTPLHNNLEELWSLLHFLNPNNFCSYNDFKLKYPDVENPNIINVNKQKQLEELQQELQEYVLRRVKKDVERSLPKKVERILRVELSPQQTEIYKSILTRNYSELSKNTGGTKTSLQNICMELKKVCNHPFLIHRPDLDPHNGITLASMQHQLIYSCGKLCLLDKLLFRLKEKGSRVLIFSQMVMMLNIISEFLVFRGYKHQRLDGTMGKELRRKAMDHFNLPNSDDFCFLLSTKAGGLGINLTSADTVIIYDSDWNPQNDLQAEARAHRIGQKKQVQIYRLVTKDSIEENILERAKTKMVLDTLVVQGLNKINSGGVEDGQNNKAIGSGNKMDFSTATSVVAMAAQALYANGKKGACSGTCFNRDELAKILKFGAQKLWSKSSNNESNSEGVHGNSVNSASSGENCDVSSSFEEDKRFASQIDLDKVLADAEENMHDTQGLADGLLRSFSNISDFRYEAPPLIVDSNTGVLVSLSKKGKGEEDDKNTMELDNKEFWERTIPEEERRRYLETRKENIVTGPRKSAMRDGAFRFKDGFGRKKSKTSDCLNDNNVGSVEVDLCTATKKSKRSKLRNGKKCVESSCLVEKDSSTAVNCIQDGYLTNKSETKTESDSGRKMQDNPNERGYRNANYPLPLLKLDSRGDFGNLMSDISGFKYDYGNLDERFPCEINNIYKSISSGKRLLKNGKRAKRDTRLLNPKKRFKVFRSILKYGDPYRRLDDIVIDSRFKKGTDADVILNEAQIIISLCYEKSRENGEDAGCSDYYDGHCDLDSNQYGEDCSLESNGNNKNKRSLLLIGSNRANPLELVDRIKALSALDKLMKECNPGVDRPWKLPTGPLSRPDRCTAVKSDCVDEDGDCNEEEDEADEEERVLELENECEGSDGEMSEGEKSGFKENVKGDNRDGECRKTDEKDETSPTGSVDGCAENIIDVKIEDRTETQNGAVSECEETKQESRSCESEGDYLKFELPPLLVKSLRMPSWGVPWTLETDKNLLKGIYVYGFSNWTLMSMDENLSLSCIRDIKFDKLKQRALRVLKNLHSVVVVGKTARKRRKTSVNSNFNSSSTSPCFSRSPLEQDSVAAESKSELCGKKKKGKTGKLQESLVKSDTNLSLVSSPAGKLPSCLSNRNEQAVAGRRKKDVLEFVKECINMDEKQLKRHTRTCLNNGSVKTQVAEIRKLFQPGNYMSDSDIVASLKLYLPSVGDEINKILELSPDETTKKRLHSSLWSFIAKCTVFQPCDIEKIYLGWKGVTNAEGFEGRITNDDGKQTSTDGKSGKDKTENTIGAERERCHDNVLSKDELGCEPRTGETG
ncbi:SNF2 family N-terminal domain-containing protein [Cryptosporidium ryanae]|uniref:SNF2 family N-terminal domain-containing protein n=1 Tax=Cryptosporidium ryanae TaxID=515981 RepID=UPI00351A7153|nr:SNF2 family N-terminal domain-containing protein [Cryptosporidium ryanae]